MSKDVVIYEKKKGIGRITLNRPEVLNSLNMEMLGRLSSLLDGARGDDGVKAVIITGSGRKSFSAGADIKYMSEAPPLEVRELACMAVEVNRKVESMGKVVVAAINGYALGGGLELAEACTLRVAAAHAMMGHPEVRIGAIAGWGGTTRLPRLIGRGRASEFLLTGRLMTAREAHQAGLINRVVESADALLPEAQAMVGEVISLPQAAVRLTLEAMQRGLDLGVEESARLGADCFGLVAATEDFREGTRAFLEKREPKYKGR